MEIVILLFPLAVIGFIVGAVAGVIWKDNRPIGVTGDYIVAVAVTLGVGLLDWFAIPALGFSATVKFLGVATEPALGALLALWIVRLVKK
ncbi:MAG: hypothetical protein ACE5FI_03380 [Anaerolineales bacterium]